MFDPVVGAVLAFPNTPMLAAVADEVVDPVAAEPFANTPAAVADDPV
jgi:hypothetical protein